MVLGVFSHDMFIDSPLDPVVLISRPWKPMAVDGIGITEIGQDNRKIKSPGWPGG